MNLQKAPLGLLGAFDLKTLGTNPPRFGEEVCPSAEVLDFYLADRLSRAAGAVTTVNAAATSSAAVNMIVPQGKVWRVLGVGTQHSVNAADVAINFFVAVGVVTGTAGISTPLFVAQTLGAPTGRQMGTVLNVPLVLPPGWGLQWASFASAAPANNTAFSNSAHIQEFDL